MGNPVNPLLGAKLLPDEVDFALPAPRPFAFSRSYLSRDGRIGVLGQGWSVTGAGLALELETDATVLTDMQGRPIRFPRLEAGHYYFSATEQLWLRRGGIPQSAPNGQPIGVFTPWDALWRGVPDSLQQDPDAVMLLAGDASCTLPPTPAGPGACASFRYHGYTATSGATRAC